MVTSRVFSERTLLDTFLSFQAQLNEYKAGSVITIDGESLGVPAIVAAACYPWPVKARDDNVQVVLSKDPVVRLRVDRSRDVIDIKWKAGKSIYGVNTGVGGSGSTSSADSRTNEYLSLSLALIQQLHIGVIHTDLYKSATVTDAKYSPSFSNTMPQPWVRGALLVRSNSLIRGHSGVRWRLIEVMIDMLNKDIIPIVPERGSISASGDLSPLSYIVGTMIGHPNILVRSIAPTLPTCAPSKIMLAPEALAMHGLEPITLLPKEALGTMNGTSFSASVAALVAFRSVGIIVLGEVCTAMGTEALLGTQANYSSFISEVCPHPGQLEVSATLYHLLESSSLASSAASQLEEPTISEDVGQLRQDRYALRTSPQWIGPLIEDIMSAVRSTEIECNSTTDNPLIEPSTSQVHNGGNFQALSLTTAFEKTRLALFLLGKLLFAQATELLNPAYNHGLPPNLAATDPSLNYHAKGLEVAMASYVSELGWLASNVGTHVQSAEMHNQSVNSIALISGRATLKSLDVLAMLISSYLYMLCHALDLRALQKYYNASLETLLTELLATHLARHFPGGAVPSPLQTKLLSSIFSSLDATSNTDAERRLGLVASATTSHILDFLASHEDTVKDEILGSIAAFRLSFSRRAAEILQQLRHSFISGKLPSSPALGYDPGAPAASFLGRTRSVYEYIRKGLGIRMHGLDHWNGFKDGLGSVPSLGYNISLIYEAIGDDSLGDVVSELFKQYPVHWPNVSVKGTTAKL